MEHVMFPDPPSATPRLRDLTAMLLSADTATMRVTTQIRNSGVGVGSMDFRTL